LHNAFPDPFSLGFGKNSHIVNRPLILTVGDGSPETDQVRSLVYKDRRMAGLEGLLVNFRIMVGHPDFFEQVGYGLPIDIHTIRFDAQSH
jgi:hypothetical protein